MSLRELQLRSLWAIGESHFAACSGESCSVNLAALMLLYEELAGASLSDEQRKTFLFGGYQHPTTHSTTEEVGE